MNPIHPYLTRRGWLRGGLALGVAAFFTPGVFADQLERTPRLTEGPFYPDKLPLDTDNDLLIVNDSITPAVGDVTHLTGRVLGPSGELAGLLTPADFARAVQFSALRTATARAGPGRH